MKKTCPPKYRRQRRKSGNDLAFVELHGRRHYLGEYGTETSQEQYHRLLAEWKSNGHEMLASRDHITVTELLARFWAYAEGYYRLPDGTPSNEMESFRSALRVVREIYGDLPVYEFGARKLKVVRHRMVELGWVRSSINRQITRIRQVFKWAVAEELIDATVLHALQAVTGLKRGRTEAPESEPVKPVPTEYVDAIQSFLSRQVWALVQLQRLTGARGGELFIMRAVDIDMAKKVWAYNPSTHKNAHHGHERRIYLGERAQEIIRPFLAGRPVDSFLFSPADAERERREAMHAARETSMSCGNTPGSNRVAKPKRKPGERYASDSYRRAIQRACDLADKAARKAVIDAGQDDPGRLIPRWHPHQLRHNAATELRKQFGIETARIILGHRSPAITELYAEADEQKAVDVMGRIG